MKTKIKELENQFTPFIFEMKIENEQDLCTLWHILRINTRDFNKGYEEKNFLFHQFEEFDANQFLEIDAIVGQLNLYK